MKKVFLVLFTIGIIVTLSSCGSDDPKKVENFFTGVCKQSTPLLSYADNLTTIGPNESTLEEMLKESDGYGTPISSGILVVTGNTSVQITGLQENMTLKGLKLNLNGLERNFGDITSKRANLYTSDNFEYFKKVFNKMLSDKRLVTKITFTSSADIKPEDEIKLEISFDGIFSYWITL